MSWDLTWRTKLYCIDAARVVTGSKLVAQLQKSDADAVKYQYEERLTNPLNRASHWVERDIGRNSWFFFIPPCYEIFVTTAATVFELSCNQHCKEHRWGTTPRPISHGVVNMSIYFATYFGAVWPPGPIIRSFHGFAPLTTPIVPSKSVLSLSKDRVHTHKFANGRHERTNWWKEERT